MKKYNSIYEYLAEFFSSNPNPSEKQIQNARKEYWRIYYKYYHRKRRSEKKEVTLCFDKKTIKQLNEKNGPLQLTKFIYHLIREYLKGDHIGVASKNTFYDIQKRLLKIVADLDEIKEFKTEKDKKKFDSALCEIENIERELSQIG